MKIKPNLNVSTDDFWYDISDGGYLKPEEICEREDDAKKVKNAVMVLMDFKNSCESQIDGFFM